MAEPAVDPEFEAALQSMQRDINCLTSDDRAVRKAAITKVHSCLHAASKTEEIIPPRKFKVPKNPVALRGGYDMKSQQRPFTLRVGDVIEALEVRPMGDRERVQFEKNGVECWASVTAGDGGVLLQELPVQPSRGEVGGVAAKPGMLGFLLAKCQQPLARCLMDPVEKCRELAAETVVALVSLIKPAEDGAIATPLFEICLRVVSQRLGQKEVEEPAEEIRLHLVMMLRAFVSQPALDKAVLAESLGEVCRVVQKMAADPFPDLKKECALTCMQLVEKLPERIAHHAPPLARAMLTNTGHQHSRVRVATLKAMRLLVLHGADTCYDDLAPQLLVLTRDRSSQVWKRAFAFFLKMSDPRDC